MAMMTLCPKVMSIAIRVSDPIEKNSNRFLLNGKPILTESRYWGKKNGRSERKGCMTEADHTETYEQRVQAIELANQPILDSFETWLRQSGLSEQTIKDHVDNMRFFSRYLLLYAYSLRRLDQANEGAVYDFLEDWFPRKALWASVSSMKVYLASFKKFYQWMGATNLVSPETVEDVLSTLKDSRSLFLRKVAE